MQAIQQTKMPLLGKSYTLKSPRLRSLTDLQQEVLSEILAEDSDSDYENVPCLCGSISSISISEIDRYGLPYHKVLCLKCGLLRVSPRWSEFRYQHFYQYQYRKLYTPKFNSVSEFILSVAENSWTQTISQWVKLCVANYYPQDSPIKIVEIGSGGGWNLASLPSSWHRIGYDVDHDFLTTGYELFGLEMKYGFLEDALNDIRNANVILLSHVLEHFLDPLQRLQEIANNIQPSALLLVEVPGIFRLHRTNLDPMSYMQSAHTYTFCSQTLKSLCMRAGFEVLEIDETIRVVCKIRLSKEVLHSEQTAQLKQSNSLASAIMRYLILCEKGFRIYTSLKPFSLKRWSLANLWKILYFPLLRFFVPRR